MPRECRFHYYTTKRARSRVKKRRRRAGERRKTSETEKHTKPRILKVMGENLAPSSSHVCHSRFEAARGFPPPAHPAIALLPVHNTPRRQQSRWLLPSLPSASSLPRRSRPSVASRSARARPVRPSRSRHPRAVRSRVDRSPHEKPMRAVTTTAPRPRVAPRVLRRWLAPPTRVSPLAFRTRARFSSRRG